MTRQTLNLGDSSWCFSQVPRQPFTTPNVYDLPTVTEWLPATVPGNVRTDLLALGRISDPFFGEGYKESLWVEEVDWWYRRDLHIEPLAPNQRAFLIFEGIDYLSAIFVNGQELTRHEGMFSRQLIEVTEALRTGSAEIAVRLWGSSALPTRNLDWRQRLWQTVAAPLYGGWAGIYPDRSATLKCQMSFGWDFAPPIRTMGIWDEVMLVISGPVFIREARLTSWPVQVQDLPGLPTALANSRETTTNLLTQESVGEDLTGLAGQGSTPANLSVDLAFEALQPQPVEAIIQVTPANFAGQGFGPFNFSPSLAAGPSQHRFDIHLPDAALWQPWDRGQPHLYNIDITIAGPSGEILDETTVRTGFRSVALQNWQFRLNGQREFIRGLNWVPADSFSGRLRTADYAPLLTKARACGSNLLRVWGGGLREKRAFYDLCDELGLLVWQEFPFACMFLDSYPRDEAYLEKVAAECGAIVRQLSHHPALVVWCGGNEFSRRRNRPLLNTLARVVQNDDGARPFIPVSPSHLHGGDAHNWHVWHGATPFQAYQAETAHFLSEFGLQALPHLDTLTAMLPDPARGWATHYADPKLLERYAALFTGETSVTGEQLSVTSDRSSVNSNQFSMTDDQIAGTSNQSSVSDDQSTARRANVSQSPREASSLPISQPRHRHSSAGQTSANLASLISASQQAQAAALQTAIEHMRRRKGEAGGVCLWQFNEPWPAISWAIVEYFGRSKLAYERLADWYNPILVSLKFPVGQQWQVGDVLQAEIWAINDDLQAYSDCTLQIELDGQPIHTQQISLSADCAECIEQLQHHFTRNPRRLTLVLHQRPKILARNSYDLDWHDRQRVSLYRRFRRWMADWVLR